MKTTIAVMLLLSTLSLARAQAATNAPDDKTLSQLKKGMTEAQIETILGIPGRARENLPPDVSILEYDFDGLSVWVELAWLNEDKQAHVTEFKVRKDGQTAAQRGTAHGRAWSQWVAAHQRKTNAVPNRVPVTD